MWGSAVVVVVVVVSLRECQNPMDPRYLFVVSFAGVVVVVVVDFQMHQILMKVGISKGLERRDLARFLREQQPGCKQDENLSSSTCPPYI